MLLESRNVKDSIKQAKVAYGNQEYIATVEKAFQVVCVSCKDSSVRYRKYLLKATQLISDVLRKAVEDKESFRDAIPTLLPRCKASLRHIETMDLTTPENNTAKDIENLIGKSIKNSMICTDFSMITLTINVARIKLYGRG